MLNIPIFLWELKLVLSYGCYVVEVQNMFGAEGRFFWDSAVACTVNSLHVLMSHLLPRGSWVSE